MNSACRPQFTEDSGYTMIELLVVMAVAAILFATGIPSFAGLLREAQLSTATNDFFASINLARAEAVQRGVRVDMVPAGDDGDWAKGWTVFVDENRSRRPDDGDLVIFRHGPSPDGMKITANLTDSTVQYLAYSGSGRTRTHANAYRTQFGTFTLALGNKTRKIKLNFVGRPRVCNPEADPQNC